MRKTIILFLIIILIPLSMQYLPQKAKINKLVEEKINPVLLSSDINISARLYLWKTALYLVKESPMVGHGAEVFSYIYTKYRYMEPVRMRGEFRVPGNVHNQFLEYAVTGGWPLLAIVLITVICFFYRCAKLYCCPPNNSCRDAINRVSTIILCIGGLAYLTVIFFAFNNICLDILWYLFLGFCAAGMNNNMLYENTSYKIVETTRRAVSAKTDRKWNNIIIIFLFLVSVFIAQCSVKNWIADYHYKNALLKKANNDYAAALSEFNKSIAVNPHNPLYLQQKGKMLQSVYAAVGGPVFMEESERAYLGALDINASCSYYWADLATLKRAAGKPREAIECYRKAVELDPYNAAFIADLATQLFDAGHTAQAEKYYLRSLDIYPYSPMTNINLANLYYTQGRFLKARFYARRASGANPDYLPAKELLKKLSRIKK